MTGRSLVIGATGYVGSALLDLLPTTGLEVTGTSRRPGADVLVATGSDLDRLLAREHFDQIVLTAQLTGTGVDWLIDRVDGRRWVVLSSAQLYSRIPAPDTEFALAREEAALARGATVFRPTMIFGRGGDTNVSRMVRAQQRWGLAIQVGDGEQKVQPLHVADLVALVAQHLGRPTAGRFDVGGPEPIPTSELVEMVKNLLGLRLPVLQVPPAMLSIASRLRLPGLRPDQLQRLDEDKMVDITATCATFGWSPEPLGHRIEQAVWEVIGERSQGTRIRFPRDRLGAIPMSGLQDKTSDRRDVLQEDRWHPPRSVPETEPSRPAAGSPSASDKRVQSLSKPRGVRVRRDRPS